MNVFESYPQISLSVSPNYYQNDSCIPWYKEIYNPLSDKNNKKENTSLYRTFVAEYIFCDSGRVWLETESRFIAMVS